MAGGADSGMGAKRMGGGMMEDLKERILTLLERQDDLTELEYLQEKMLLVDECMSILSGVLECYERLA